VRCLVEQRAVATNRAPGWLAVAVIHSARNALTVLFRGGGCGLQRRAASPPPALRVAMGQAFKRFLEQLGDIGLLTANASAGARRPFKNWPVGWEQLEKAGGACPSINLPFFPLWCFRCKWASWGRALALCQDYISCIMGLSLFRDGSGSHRADDRAAAGDHRLTRSMKVTERSTRCARWRPARSQLVVPRVGDGADATGADGDPGRGGPVGG
jgi:hypothetical protein